MRNFFDQFDTIEEVDLKKQKKSFNLFCLKPKLLSHNQKRSTNLSKRHCQGRKEGNPGAKMYTIILGEKSITPIETGNDM